MSQGAALKSAVSPKLVSGGELCSSTQPCTKNLKFIRYAKATLPILAKVYLWTSVVTTHRFG